jgi:hypothetical protein
MYIQKVSLAVVELVAGYYISGLALSVSKHQVHARDSYMSRRVMFVRTSKSMSKVIKSEVHEHASEWQGVKFAT